MNTWNRVIWGKVEDLLIWFWELSLKPQAWLTASIIFMPIKMGGADPQITHAEIYRDLLDNYFTNDAYITEKTTLQNPPPEKGENNE